MYTAGGPFLSLVAQNDRTGNGGALQFYGILINSKKLFLFKQTSDRNTIKPLLCGAIYNGDKK
jgi:hypothetical protein